MTLSDEDVLKIARLARLRLSPEETKVYAGHMSRVLELMGHLRALDASGVAPMTAAASPRSVLRDDVPAAFEDTESILGQAPTREGPYFKTRKVL